MKNSQLITRCASLVLLVAVLSVVFESWTSSRRLSWTLNGNWTSERDGQLHIFCDDFSDSVMTGSCKMNCLNGEQLVRLITISPLSDGGWFWVGEGNGNSTVLSLVKETLYVQQLDGSHGAVYSRGKSSQTLTRMLQVKAKYFVALFLLIGSYKWAEVALGGADWKPSKSRRRSRW